MHRLSAASYVPAIGLVADAKLLRRTVTAELPKARALMDSNPEFGTEYSAVLGPGLSRSVSLGPAKIGVTNRTETLPGRRQHGHEAHDSLIILGFSGSG